MTVRGNGDRQLSGPARELQHSPGLLSCEIDVKGRVPTGGQKLVVQVRVIVEVSLHTALDIRNQESGIRDQDSGNKDQRRGTEAIAGGWRPCCDAEETARDHRLMTWLMNTIGTITAGNQMNGK